jgi:hypothetical protein
VSRDTWLERGDSLHNPVRRSKSVCTSVVTLGEYIGNAAALVSICTPHP